MKIPNSLLSIAENAALVKHTELLDNSAVARALGELENTAAARAVQEFERLQLPRMSATDEIVAAYNSKLESQYRSIQEFLKYSHSQVDLGAFNDTITRQVAAAELIAGAPSYRLKIEQLAVPTLIEAAILQLKQPQFQVLMSLQEMLEKNKDVAAIVQSIRSPWANPNNLLGSTVALVEATALFEAAHYRRPFDDRVTDYLRFELGDYRDLLEPETRSNLYAEHGLRDELGQTPGEVLVDAERYSLRIEPAATIATPFSFEAMFFSKGIAPQLMAYQTIYILERRLRDVIGSEMTREFGHDWTKTHLRQDLRDDWVRKQGKAKDQGEVIHPLIHYADFTHYELIITGQSAWKAIFQPIFKRQEDVRESLKRLGGVRLVACHSRDVLPMDILMLAAEGTRLMSALSSVPP
jgi:hypothetical protein